MKQKTTKWESTKTPGLYVRRPGETFYARITVDGKRSWRSLDTTKLREAQGLLRDLQSGRTRQVATRGHSNLHDALQATVEFRAVRRGMDRPLKKSTASYHLEILASAKKLFADRPLGSFTTVGMLKAIQDCDLSQSRRKAIFELLKRTFADAVESGTLKTNPLAGQIPGQVQKKERNLPTRQQLDELVETIKVLFPRYGHRAALACRFLAFSGMRKMEARSVEWPDVADGKIKITGTPEEGTKTGAIRFLDINPPLQQVLDDIAAVYGRKGRVMPAKSILPQLKAACEKMGIQVLDHHDLRAWFITWGITSGVDVSTLAGWVGNSPEVLLKRYASVQDEERKSAAAKMS